MLISNLVDEKGSITSDVKLDNVGGKFTYLDGWQEKKYEKISINNEQLVIGVYNDIEIDEARKHATITNDAFGQRHLYVYSSSKGFALSDSLWLLAKVIPCAEVNWNVVEETIVALRPSNPSETWIKDVYVLPAGVRATIKWGSDYGLDVKHRLYMNQSEDENMEFREAIDETINALDETFQFIKKTGMGIG